MPDAVLGIVGALAGVLLGQLLGRNGEYIKWLRSERHRSAAELLACGEAFKRHAADRVLAMYGGEPIDSQIHLADLERLALTLEAVRTVFPARPAAVADDFGEAARQLAHAAGPKRGEPTAEPGPAEPTAGQRYEARDSRTRHQPQSSGDRYSPRYAAAFSRQMVPERM